ncbi:MAG: SH3 domain-containing protein [Peptococcaceae bacterium]|jgi:uncharacterized protein YgiM (DUF1202 family)|nr:SH3 domain-containing protein [Peptococcaceae bacterium]
MTGVFRPRALLRTAVVCLLSLALAAPAQASGLWLLKSAAGVRTGPGLDYAVIEDAGGQGQPVQVTGRQGRWFQVRLPDGTSGWMAGHSLTSFPGPGTPATITWPEVALFEGPGTGYRVTDWLHTGDVVRVLGRSGVWAQVTAADGNGGWLPAALLTGAPRPAAGSLPVALAVYGASSLWVRGGPAVDARALTLVHTGDILKVTGRFGDWYQVRTPDGLPGWVDGRYTRPAAMPEQGPLLAGVTQKDADLFAGPGTGYPVVAAAGRGSYFTIMKADGAWRKVKLADGREGWLPAALVGNGPGPVDPGTSVIAGKGVWFEANDRITGTTDLTSPAFRNAGITHIYLEAGTSRDGFPAAWQKQLDILLPAAHKAHIKVILWVFVGLHNIARDAALTGQVANFVTPGGQRPDGVAADIEDLISNPGGAMQLVSGYASLTRPLLPKGMPLIAVTYPPQFEANYPFAALADDFNAVALMDYWHTTVNDYGSQGAAGLIRDSLVLFRGKAGRSVPLEVILEGFDGGAGLPDQREMQGALNAARSAQGYSVYTWQSMNGLLRETFSRFR